MLLLSRAEDKCGSLFCPSTTWGRRAELELSALMASPFICRAILPTRTKLFLLNVNLIAKMRSWECILLILCFSGRNIFVGFQSTYRSTLTAYCGACIIYMYECLTVYMFVHYMCAVPKEGIGSRETGVADGCQLPGGCWESDKVFNKCSKYS